MVSRPKNLDGKRVLIVGLGATATDIARGLVGIAKSIFISHRNGCLMVRVAHVRLGPQSR
jgi:dimethylaniline monooxygenase (N-oxide forming)